MDAQNVHDEVIVIAEIETTRLPVLRQETKSMSSTRNETWNQCDETSEVTSNVNLEAKNEEVPQECDSTAMRSK